MGFLGFQCRCANIRLTFMAASYFQGHEPTDPMISRRLPQSSPDISDRNRGRGFVQRYDPNGGTGETGRCRCDGSAGQGFRPCLSAVLVLAGGARRHGSDGRVGRHVPVGPQRDAACCRLSQALTRSARLLHANRYPPRIKSGAGFRWKMLSAPHTAAVTARCAITLTRLAR
jgi:hypothetical protein